MERSVPLLSFAKYGLTNTPLAVNHQGQFAASTISFNLPLGSVAFSGNGGDSESNGSVSAFPVPSEEAFRGRPRHFSNHHKACPWLILAALIAIYIVLGILYESYVHPVTIISTLPSAGVGALLALMIFQYGVHHHGFDRSYSADRHRQEECHL
jgi:multidrug efflux pump